MAYRRMRTGLVAAAALAAGLTLAGTAAAQRVNTERGQSGAQEIIAAEQAFARRTGEVGVPTAFRETMGREAVLFLPEPTVVNRRIDTVPFPVTLTWRPAFVAIASSGDLAASAGPGVATTAAGEGFSYYMTVWRREGTGWRWILDGGVDTPTNLYAEPAAAAPEVLIGRAREGAGFDLQRMEADFARDAARDVRRAISSRFEERGQLLRDGYRPATSRTEAASLLGAGPTTMVLTMRDGSTANAGDLAYARGDATWTDASGAAQTGWWVHVWRRDGNRWRIALDMLKRSPTEAERAAAAAAAAAAPPPAPAPMAQPMTPATPAPMAPPMSAPTPMTPAPMPAPAAPAPAPTPTTPPGA